MALTGNAAASTAYTHVQFDTTMGTFIVELYHRHTPRTCYNMAALADAGYYDGTIFHRIIKDFMIQGGDPTGTGRGGESVYGGKFEDGKLGIFESQTLDIFTDLGPRSTEITRNLKHVGAGVVSMANAGPNTNGSQFFITLKPCSFLDGKHTIFGRIYSGMGVIQRMGLIATDGEDRPKCDVKIHRAFALRSPPDAPISSTGQQQLAQISA
ncbi:hypothetical protein ACHAWF_000868 [Thalassiosira exigua]